MSLTLPKALAILPKLIVAITTAVDTVDKIKALPVKNAKSIGLALGVVQGSFAYELCDLTDDVIGAAGG
jgi:hypothetical protein